MRKKKRRAGVLLHPTILFGKEGIGTFGRSAYEFVDFLNMAGITIWQVLPLTSPGYGESPYSCTSAFAGNPLLIDLELLLEEGYLCQEDLNLGSFPEGYIDFQMTRDYKIPLLEKAGRAFLKKERENDRKDYDQFEKMAESWLSDYALFTTIKAHYDEKAKKTGESSLWISFWDKEDKYRDDEALKRWQQEKTEEIALIKVVQYFFYQQWMALKNYANSKSVFLVGDIPAFVSLDSADIWAHPEIFKLDKDLNPYVVAGVPPDYFSSAGQIWGNPLYNWKVLKDTSFDWWTKRFLWVKKMVDCVRIDHFRGFESCWEIPAGNESAVHGKWVKSEGEALFTHLTPLLADFPIWVEDLGDITPEVIDLRDKFKFMGLKILMFAFEGSGEGIWSLNPFLPHNYSNNSVVYTGTHDNNTTRGWFNYLEEEKKVRALAYINTNEVSFVWDFIRLAFSSVADFAIIPMQDYLNLGDEARMNIPSTIDGNWRWRMKRSGTSYELAESIKKLTECFSR